MSAPEPKPTNVTPDRFSSFDYVVIGGGTAGLACASRLSDDPNVTVGVLEAGHWRPDDPKVNVPAMMAQGIMDPTYDWCLKSVPQAGSNDREWILPRGKMLGGSSALNFLCWQRGFRTDFDDMAKLGNPGWDWDSLTTTYNALTKTNAAATPLTDVQTQNGAHVDAACHGTNGKVDLTHAHWYCDAQKPWWNMLLRSADLKHVKDGSGSGETYGMWNTLVTVDPATSMRVHAGTAFYDDEHRQRANFKVLTNAHVARIELQQSSTGLGQRASGVTYIHDGKQYTVKVNREVIVCAGTFFSPQILELSGIGDKDILQANGIPVKVANENVGKNLQEHLFISSVYEMDKDTVTFDKLKDGEFAQKAMVFLGDDRKNDTTGGILGSPVVTAFGYSSVEKFMTQDEMAALRKIAKQNHDEDKASWSEGMRKGHEMQMAKLLHARCPSVEYSLLPAFFCTEGVPKDQTGYISPLTFLQYPLSRGTVHIRSDDPLEPPAIDPRYFSNKADVRLMAHAMKSSVEWIEKDAELGKVLVERHAPKEQLRSIEEWEEYVRQHAGTTYHPVGTCSMMPKGIGGVVDSQLRVYGTENVRVADASVIPLMPSGHIQAACYVIGYKAADMMRKQSV